jgi:hypothetical protein
MSTAFKRFDKASAEFVAATEFELNDISARGFLSRRCWSSEEGLGKD